MTMSTVDDQIRLSKSLDSGGTSWTVEEDLPQSRMHTARKKVVNSSQLLFFKCAAQSTLRGGVARLRGGRSRLRYRRPLRRLATRAMRGTIQSSPACGTRRMSW